MLEIELNFVNGISNIFRFFSFCLFTCELKCHNVMVQCNLRDRLSFPAWLYDSTGREWRCNFACLWIIKRYLAKLIAATGETQKCSKFSQTVIKKKNLKNK